MERVLGVAAGELLVASRSRSPSPGGGDPSQAQLHAPPQSADYGPANGSQDQYSNQSNYYHGSPGSPGPPGSRGPNPVGLGEMPMDDGGAQQQGPTLMPSAPPLNEMDRIAGYDKILLPNVSFVPPPPYTRMAETGAAVQQFVSSAWLTEHEARDLLYQTAKFKCCWGVGAAREMEFRNLQLSTAVHYVLRTFLETRSTEWASEPFHGQTIDGPMNGQAPDPWQIQVERPDMFEDVTYETEVPHTASVRPCHGCNGFSTVTCRHCAGWGLTKCFYCSGTGVQNYGESRTCSGCAGDGRIRCRVCIGRGRVSCPTCQAAGQVKCYVRMTTKFVTHMKEFIIERTPLPDYLIRDVDGTSLP